ncbi:response regulator [Sphingomonas sp.]|uniref:response regulator n=1 Tax=Sphingomonas sp. TaxID=28214 RepID=UPI001DCD6577|nr:response regulator [Sphingomonas sp.]MBX9796817.1 response regulator [Sphingomonas sp.]
MTGPRRILVVEDEPLIVLLLGDVLDSIGKTMVGPADSVAEGLALVAAGGIDAAILDLRLRGGETSIAVAQALEEAGIPFVFASGGGIENVAPDYAEYPMLGKPFTIDAVAEALDALV